MLKYSSLSGELPWFLPHIILCHRIFIPKTVYISKSKSEFSTALLQLIIVNKQVRKRMKLLFLIQVTTAVHHYLELKSYFVKLFPKQAEINRLINGLHFSVSNTGQGIKPKQLRTHKGRRNRYKSFHLKRSRTKQ